MNLKIFTFVTRCEIEKHVLFVCFVSSSLQYMYCEEWGIKAQINS